MWVPVLLGSMISLTHGYMIWGDPIFKNFAHFCLNIILRIKVKTSTIWTLSEAP